MSPGNRSNPQDQKTSQENTSHHVKPGRLGKRRGQLNRRIRSGRLMVGFLAARRTSAGGRLPEVTVGCFVEAKHEMPRQSVGQLWSDLAGRFGSFSTKPTDRFAILPF